MRITPCGPACPSLWWGIGLELARQLNEDLLARSPRLAVPGSPALVGADLATGVRRVPAVGNAGMAFSWTLTVPSDPVYWSVQTIDGAHLGSFFPPENVIGSPTGVAEGTALPTEVALGPVTPNPVRHSTRITFALPFPGVVTLDIFDVSGRLMKSLARGFHEAGNHSELWNATDDSGARLPAGVYLARLKTAAETRTLKIVLAR